MSYLHEIINKTDKYVLVLGIHESQQDWLFVYNLTSKTLAAYKKKSPSLHGMELGFHNNCPWKHMIRMDNALWLLRQETHQKSPAGGLINLHVNLDDYEMISGFTGGIPLLSRFRAMLIDKGECLCKIDKFPTSLAEERNMMRLHLGPLRTRHYTEVHIDVPTPHNIAKKIQKIYRKINSPETDLVDALNF